MKKCIKCLIEKSLSEFHKKSDSKDGKCPLCKICNGAKTKQWKQDNLEQYKKTYESWRSIHRPRKKIVDANYRVNNIERIKKEKARYYQKHKQEINIKVKTKLQTNPIYKLRHSLRTRLKDSLRRGTKSGSFVRDLGCSVHELKQYLESKFKSGMTWENHGDWHIDHIKPLSSFDLTDRDQFLQACHYTNLQPLWAEENLKKGNKLCG